MTWTAKGSLIQSDAAGQTLLALNNVAVGDLIVLTATVNSTTIFANSISGGGVAWDAPQGHGLGTNGGWSQTLFTGKVTATGAANVTIGYSGTVTSLQIQLEAFEYASSVGAWKVDAGPSFLDNGGGNVLPSLTPSAAGDLYVGYEADQAAATAGSTSGYVYVITTNSNCWYYNLNCTSATQSPTLGTAISLMCSGILIQEVQSAPVSVATPGRTWKRRFQHSQTLKPPEPPPPAAPTWAVRQSASGTIGSGTVSASYGSNLISGSKLIAYVGSSQGPAPSAVKDTAGNSFTQVASSAAADGTSSTVWVLDTPAGDVGGTTTVTATIAANNGAAILIQEVTGLLPGTTVSVDGTAGSVHGNNASPFYTGSPSYTTAAAGEFLVSFYQDDGDGGGVSNFAAAGYTRDANSISANGSGDVAVSYKASTGLLESDAWTLMGSGTTSWNVIMLAFQTGSPALISSAAAPALPGRTWKRQFQHPQVLPLAPAISTVTSTGSFVLAPLAFSATGAQTSPDTPVTTPGPTWLDLFKPWVQRPRPPAPARGQVSSSGSFSLAPLAFSGQGAQTSPDIPVVQPGSTWLDLFKPWAQKPRPIPPAVQSVNSAGAFTLAPLAFLANAGQTSPDVPSAQPGITWQRLFRPYVPKPVPPLPAGGQVSATGSISLAPIAFSAAGSQTSPDLPLQPGTTWTRLFRPWVPKPRPWLPDPTVPAVNPTATGSFTLAPLAFAAQGGATSPDLPLAAGPQWTRLFRPWIPKPLPPLPGREQVSSTGSVSLAPLAFSAAGGQTSPDIRQIQPGPMWLRLLRPWIPRPLPPLPARDQVSTSGSFSLAPVAFAGTGAQTSPDIPSLQPGPVWTRLFRPWVNKPVPPLPSVPPQTGIQATGSFALAPLAFTAQGGVTSPDITQVQPGPYWLRIFKPWVQRPVPPVPAVQNVGSTGSFTLAPIAFAAAGAQTSPDQPAIQPGPVWTRLFRPWVRKPLPPLPARDQVSVSGNITLAPLAFAASGGQTSPDIPSLQPGSFWLRLFKPWVTRPVPPVPAQGPLSATGSLSLAPLAFSGTGAQTSPDIPQIIPGPSWLKLFRPWRKQLPWLQSAPPTSVPCSGGIALAPLAFHGSSISPAAVVKYGVPHDRWGNGGPEDQWETGITDSQWATGGKQTQWKTGVISSEWA